MANVPPPREMPPAPEPQPNGTASHSLVCAVYLLLRDHIPAGALEKVVAQVEGYGKSAVLIGPLADYATIVADTLQAEGPRGS